MKQGMVARTGVLAGVVALVAALVLVSCGDGSPGTEPDASAETPPGAGAPADGGLSVAEARDSDVGGPLVVRGFIVLEGEVVRLSDLLMESFPPQCGGESLIMEGAELNAFETSVEGDVRWTNSPVSVLGEVEGDTLRLSETAT
jgi:hypothetical protein